VYGKDSYSLAAVKNWVRAFKAQRTHFQKKVRPGRP
jgi:transposase